jgi:hypothetical protein
MNRKSKLIAGILLLLCGAALIGWNMRDPDAGFREPPKQERAVTASEVPLAVQSAIKRVSAGGKIEKILEKRRGEQVTYEVDLIHQNLKTEFKFHEDGSVVKQKTRKLKLKKPATRQLLSQR